MKRQARVRVKPTRTERRQRLERALEETGLGKMGVEMTAEDKAAVAATRGAAGAGGAGARRETRAWGDADRSRGGEARGEAHGREDRSPARAPAARGDARGEARGDARGRDDRSPARAPAARGEARGREERSWGPSRGGARGGARGRDERARGSSARDDDRPRGGDAGRQRRALSMPAAPGRIAWDGDPRFARALGEALRDANTDDVVAESLTHPVHAYPARMHPATARRLIEIVMSAGADAGGGLLVDPFCGSGTTLVEARAAGVRALGSDLNPLAVRLARAKTWTAPVARRRALRETGRRITGFALEAGREARRAGAAAPALRGPAGFDPNARNRRLARWFAPHVRRELETIAGAIDEVRAQDAELAVPLEVALSAILYKVSSRTSDTDPTWVERHVARGAAARLFGQRVDMLCAGLDDLCGAPGAMPEVLEADARSLTKRLGNGAARGVVTSPPYAGTYDYAEQHRLRFDFLGLRHRALDEGELGARRAWDDAAGQGDADRAWRAQLAEVLRMMEAILAPGGRAALVVGDSIAGGRAMRADDDVRACAPAGLVPAAWAAQERPMLGVAERRAFGDRPKLEHVILLVRR